MAWSYDPTDLNTTTASGRLNTVRFLVGDTDTNNQQVQNEEITFSLSQTADDVYTASAYVARSIASQYASKVNIEVDGQIKADYSDLYEHYKALATNRVGPEFRRDRFWNPPNTDSYGEG